MLSLKKIDQINKVRFISNEGESTIIDNMKVCKIEKSWLLDKFNNSFVFMAFDKENIPIIQKNTHSFFMKFLGMLKVAKRKYESSTRAEQTDLMVVFPFGEMPLKNILENSFQELIQLEKSKYKESFISNSKDVNDYYLESVSILCNRLGILDPLSLVSFNLSNITIH